MPIIILIVFFVFVVLPLVAVYYTGKGVIHGAKVVKEIGYSIGESNSKARQEKQKILKLESISRKNGKIFIDYGKEKSTVTGYDSFLKSVDVRCDSTRVSQLFPAEYKHAVWRLEYISELKSPHTGHWNKISSLAKKAVRLVEKRNRLVESSIQDSQVDSIIELEDKALIGLNYICDNLKNKSKTAEIQQELNDAQREIKVNSDPIRIKSIETRIATHQRRLAKQETVKNKLFHIEEEVKSLEATFKLIVEELESVIQEHRLDNASYKLGLNYSLTELQLPLLDQMFLEQASSVS